MRKMTKPEMVTVQHYIYDECADWVAHKLGIDDLNDVLGHFHDNPEAQYLNYWHYLCERGHVAPETVTYIDSYLLTQWHNMIEGPAPEWTLRITQCFIDEFGAGASYYVEF